MGETHFSNQIFEDSNLWLFVHLFSVCVSVPLCTNISMYVCVETQATRARSDGDDIQ